MFAANGAAALEEATRKAPDVILLDVMMPQMDGFEVCRHLRLDPLLAEVAIILVTALEDRPSRLRGLEVGADDFISKPVDVIELRTRIRNVVRLNRYRKLLQERAKAQQAQVEVLSSCETILAAWVRILERDNRVVPNRCDLVTNCALRLAKSAGMPESGLITLRWSILLHSIGAMIVPSMSRSREDSSHGKEERIFRQEAWIIEALSPVPVLREALNVLACRHEHWNGSGQPRGLKGEDIPLAARVLAVVLAWDADSSTPAARLAILKAQAGQHFEPRLLEALDQVVNELQEPQAAPANSMPDGAAPAKESRPRPSLLRRISISTTGARAQFAVALALISVIPLLVVNYLCLTGWLGIEATVDQLYPLMLMVLPFMALGYWMLVKYPIDVLRLRNYLESLAHGTSPMRIKLVTDEDDLAAIEALMREVVRQTETRIRTIQVQTNALLDAERERVMIQSLGTACHHLGQPVTVISAYLEMTRRLKLPLDAQKMLKECQTATGSVASILERLQRLTVYRTEPYLRRDEQAPSASSASSSIVKM